MGLKHLVISVIMAGLLISSVAYADDNCTTWVRCDYLPFDDDPTLSYVALSNSESLRLLEGITWYEIPVAGRENELGQALVCIYSETEPRVTVNEAAQDAGCDVIDRKDVRGYLVPPFERYRNSRTGKVEFADGRGGRHSRKKTRLMPNPAIKDDIVRPLRGADGNHNR